jgi:uncharacterized protein YuzB (UPF0349 family)
MGETKRLIRIDFCNGNLMSFAPDLVARLREEHPEWQVSRYGCLTNCGECAMKPFAIVNDEIIAADTVSELEAKLNAEAERIATQ